MKKLSILIIDDDVIDSKILKRILNKSDMTGLIFEELNGEAGIQFLTNYESNVSSYPDSFPPSLIFLDINMPIMGGFEFLDKFSEIRRTVSKYDACVFTMLTSSEREEDKEKALSYEFVKDFIIKGDFSVDDFENLVNKYVYKI